MIKKIFIIYTIFLLLTSFSTNSSALSLIGFVNPILDTGSTTTGTAIYSFDVSGLAGEGLTGFSLDFISSAFSSVSNYNTLSGPVGWNGSLLPGSGAFTNFVDYSGLINAGTSFSFSVRFTLQGLGTADPNFNTAAFWGPTNTAWQQNFGSMGTPGSHPRFPGGSTGMAPAPEPGTLLLLGGGLIAAGAVRRFRRKRRLN